MKKTTLFRHQQGFSLIEVMLAVTILSISLLGFTQAQLVSLQATEHAYAINLAHLKNVELAERFKRCEFQTLCLQQARALWTKEIEESFPKGIGLISEVNLSNFQSKIQWFSNFSKSLESIDLFFSL